MKKEYRECNFKDDFKEIITILSEETPCSECGATGLHGCTGKKYPGSDESLGINKG